jgi:hypothetical protein
VAARREKETMTASIKHDYKIGDQVWWFQTRAPMVSFASNYSLRPDSLELVHDVITDIQDGRLICWHGTHCPLEVWGKSRKEAWNRLKSKLEKWGQLDVE